MTIGHNRVEDDEQLYRRVPEKAPGGELCFRLDSGRVKFLSAAFNDREKRPSVNRAKLHYFNPHRTRVSEEDGIVALLTSRVRQLGLVQVFDQRGQVRSEHAIDVIPDPKAGNLAHAVIITQPPLTKDNAFKRLKDSLARLATDAGWYVEPGTPMPKFKFLAFLRDAYQWVMSVVRRIK